MSMLIRHELLHQILNHVQREIIEVAKRKGIDPDSITKVQFEDILKAMNRTTDFNLRGGNTRSFGNRAGDTDLSRYYKLVDKDLVRTMGGLLLDDHPDWIKDKLYFEQIIQRCRQEDFLLRKRVTNKRHGTFTKDEDGNITSFNQTSEEPSVFKGTIIDTKDVKHISIPSVKDVHSIMNIKLSYCWLEEASEDPDLHKCLLYSTDIRDIDITRSLYVYPVLTISNSDLYINIFKDNTATRCTCGGYDFIALPGTNKIISQSYIVESPFNNLGDSNEYKDSLVKQIVDEWWAKRRIK